MMTNGNNSTFIAGWHRFKPNEQKELCGDDARRKKAKELFPFAVAWNVFIALIVFTIMPTMTPRWGFFMTEKFLVIVPFALIGLGMLGYSGYHYLKTRNPSVTVRVSGQGAYAGDKLGLSWRISGRVDKIKRFEIYLEGREMATSHRDTTVTTHSKPFMRIPVYASEKVVEFEAGQAMADLSEVVMPTFVSVDNQIRYFLCLKGKIPRWPDIDDEFEIDIWPANAKEVQR